MTLVTAGDGGRGVFAGPRRVDLARRPLAYARPAGEHVGAARLRTRGHEGRMPPMRRIVAERILEFRHSQESQPKNVRVRIGAPQKEGNDWSVVYEIRGPGRRREKRKVWGVDSVQALHMAMGSVPVDVRGIEMSTGGKVTFLGGDDLMFPSFK